MVKNTIKSAIGSIPENKLIFASKLYEEQFSNQTAEGTYYQTLSRMCEAGTLCRVGKGVYYRPRKGKYGVLPLPQSEIISAFTGEGSGAVVGYAMYYEHKLTTQIPKSIEVLSSKVGQPTRSIGNVTLLFCGLSFTPEVISALYMLEVLQNYEKIQELDSWQFLRFCESFASQYSEEALQQVILARKYKKRTLSFLKNVLEYYGVPNHLAKYLSSMSEYNHPTMEAIYEAARVS